MAIEALSDIQRAGGSAFAGGGSSTPVDTGVTLGASPSRSGKFVVVDAEVTPTSKVRVELLPSPYTGKGSTLSDECELMGPVQFVPQPQNGQITVYWSSPFVQRGSVNIRYHKE